MFVALEGIDGAGKTSALRSAAEHLRARGYAVTAFPKQHPPVEDPYVRRHLDALRSLIWEHPDDDPYYRLGQYHWVHLVASWFHAVHECVVRPMRERGELVLVDNWIHKGLARLRLNESVDYDQVEGYFTAAGEPDLVILLDISPEVAASRKASFTAIEAGNLHAHIGINQTNFIRYQQRLRRELHWFAARDGWPVVPASEATVEEIGSAVADAVAERRSTPTLA